MYTMNHRDVKFNESKGLILLRGGIINRSDLTNVLNNEIVVKDITFGIAKRIYMYTDIEVLKENEWNHVPSGDEKSLIDAFDDTNINSDIENKTNNDNSHDSYENVEKNDDVNIVNEDKDEDNDDHDITSENNSESDEELVESTNNDDESSIENMEVENEESATSDSEVEENSDSTEENVNSSASTIQNESQRSYQNGQRVNFNHKKHRR